MVHVLASQLIQFFILLIAVQAYAATVVHWVASGFERIRFEIHNLEGADLPLGESRPWWRLHSDFTKDVLIKHRARVIVEQHSADLTPLKTLPHRHHNLIEGLPSSILLER